MSIKRTRTARDLTALAGGWPSAALAVAAVSLLAAPAAAQTKGGDAPAAAQTAKPRDPMKSDKAKDDQKVSVSDNMTVDLHVKDEDLINVLELLSIQTQKNIVASKTVAGKVTATLYGVTFYQALDAILHVNGFGYVENGNFIYVYTNDELKAIEASLKKRVSKVIRLNYLNADDAKSFVEPLLSKDGGEIKTSAKTATFSIPDKAPVGKNDYALGDTIVVIDFEENIKAIEELVKQIDTRPSQVLVEATILQTALNEANAWGVDFSVIGNLNFLDFINVGGPLAVANSLISGGTGATGSGLSPTRDGVATGVTSSPGNTAGPGTFKVGVIAGDAAIFVRMLDQITDTVILSNPKILALNRQPARVLVGKRVGYLNTTSTETSTTQTVEFLDTGTQLYFRPFVSSDGEVRMELKPQVSSAEIRNVTDAKGAAVTIPDEVTQEIVTNVNVRDGQTIVLGGLFTESSSFTRRQVPWVGDIPILGAAFRGNEDSTLRSEIIFLVTPTIVSDTQLAASAERAAGDIEHVRTGTRQGLLPWSREKMTDQLNVEAEKFARDGNYERAMFNIKRSLSLNANQPEVYRLRDRITNQHEHWNNSSMLDFLVSGEVNKRLESVAPSDKKESIDKPKGSVHPVFEPVKGQPNFAPGSNKKSEGPENSESPTYVNSDEGQQSSNNNPSNDNAANNNAVSDNSSLNVHDLDVALQIEAQPATDMPAGMNTPGMNAPESAQARLDDVYRATMLPAEPNAALEPTPAATYVQSEQMGIAQPLNSDPTSPAPSTALFNAPTEPEAAPTAEGDATLVMTGEAPAADADVTEGEADTTPATDAEPSPQTVGVVTPASTHSGPFLAAPANVSALRNPSGESPQVFAVRGTLTSLRIQIKAYQDMNDGTLPALGFDDEKGWTPLTDAKLLKCGPCNSYVSGPNSDKVIARETPDTAFNTDYGWVFNPTTGQIWAAGFDANDKPFLNPDSMTSTGVSKAGQPTANTTPAQPADAHNGNGKPADAISSKGNRGSKQPKITPQNPPEPATAGVETENHK